MRQFIFPEPDKAAFFLFFVPVNRLVYFGCQVVEVESSLAIRVVGAGIREVIG